MGRAGIDQGTEKDRPGKSQIKAAIGHAHRESTDAGADHQGQGGHEATLEAGQGEAGGGGSCNLHWRNHSRTP